MTADEHAKVVQFIALVMKMKDACACGECGEWERANQAALQVVVLLPLQAWEPSAPIVGGP